MHGAVVLDSVDSQPAGRSTNTDTAAQTGSCYEDMGVPSAADNPNQGEVESSS